MKGGWGKVPEGGGICVLGADSCYCIAEANTILQTNYPPAENKLKKYKKISIAIFTEIEQKILEVYRTTKDPE